VCGVEIPGWTPPFPGLTLGGEPAGGGWETPRRVTIAKEPTRLELLDRARAGDREALETLLRVEDSRLRDWLRTRMGARLRRRLGEDDALQETYARAVESFASFEDRGEGSLFRWLCSIGEHVILKAAEVERRKPLLTLRHEVEARGITGSHAARREERFERLQSAVDGLPDDYRTVVRLARIEGVSVAEIARRMGRSPAAVSMLLSRALRKLKERFGDTESLGLPDRRLETDRESGSDDRGQ
jgi:RNA polymerase sigma-70 factor (ECF subfamily)